MEKLIKLLEEQKQLNAVLVAYLTGYLRGKNI